ncbi:hypothetical protein L207DRAFT_635934 [Hyaloscypha variabilis F]|uniref:IBR domain-containing protein n=1 Tax=Hyaloscypha variabilis (strain UAMH 11265 / GT02V1 / F) TaxID=1149755 RepID=A0A2J6RF82_HYAVF|nr:hypothetical protein L207DRAFT_635934 [Hyaloscypha variabilis F]
MHLLRQEEADRAYRSAHGYTENREDEARWRHLKQSTEPGWVPARFPSPPPVRTPRRAAPPPRSQPAPFRPPPREMIRTRPFQRSARQETRECSICVEDKTLDNFPVVTANCTHQPAASSACVRTWIAGTLNGISWSRISCLSPEYTEILQYKDMRRIAAREIFQHYEKFSTREAIRALSNFHYCLNPECESGQEYTPYTNKMFVCNACRHTACVACDKA